MPYKSDKIKIAGGQYDRRIKLTEEDKDKIRALAGAASIRAIARMFGVDRRLIQFILYPERHERNLLLRKERGGSAVYYNKEKNTQTHREHIQYKQKLYVEGQIK